MKTRNIAPGCLVATMLVPVVAAAQPDNASSLPPLPPPPPEETTGATPAAEPSSSPGGAHGAPPAPPAGPAPAVPSAGVAPPPSPPDVAAPAEQGEPSGPTGLGEALARMPKFIVASVGLGRSVAFASDNHGTGSGNGFYGAVELVLVPSLWFSPRAYAGVLLTGPDRGSCGPATVVTAQGSFTQISGPCDVSATIGFFGVKGRLTIPIPFVAPYLELGIGGSVGAMTTETWGLYKTLTSVTYHVPVGIGLSIGAWHRYVVDVGLAYLFHPAQEQFDGAFALSLAFRLP